jgi:CelD/BcsL family acetyltransferase involved in cellulose biosynthesis
MYRVRKLRLLWMREDGLLWPHLASARDRISYDTSAPYIDLARFPDWDTYFAGLSKNLRTDHGRKMRQLARRGAVDFRLATDATVAGDVAWLFEAKRAWIDRTRKQVDWLQAPETEAFFAEAAAEGLDSGRTWLTVLSVDGETIAAYLNFREGPILYLSKLTFDFAWQHYSPGRALMLMTLEHAFKNGIEKYDLMIGKHRWKGLYATGEVRITSPKFALRGRGSAGTRALTGSAPPSNEVVYGLDGYDELDGYSVSHPTARARIPSTPRRTD